MKDPSIHKSLTFASSGSGEIGYTEVCTFPTRKVPNPEEILKYYCMVPHLVQLKNTRRS